jgi:hypothetical protein
MQTSADTRFCFNEKNANFIVPRVRDTLLEQPVSGIFNNIMFCNACFPPPLSPSTTFSFHETHSEIAGTVSESLELEGLVWQFWHHLNFASSIWLVTASSSGVNLF